MVKDISVCGGAMPSGKFLKKQTDCTGPLHLGIIGIILSRYGFFLFAVYVITFIV